MKKFKKIYIEITNICNMACDFCPGTSREPVIMSKELFEKILLEIRFYTEQVYFHVMGEPLLHPEIDLFLELCEKFGLKVNITTNGTLIDRHTDTLLSKPALRQVNFSLHSHDANQTDVSLEKYLQRIFDFIDRSKEVKKLLIGLRLWNITDKESNNSNRLILEQIQSHFTLDTQLVDSITPINGIKLADNIFLHIAKVFEWPDLNEKEIVDKGFCYGIRDQVAILSNGTVVPCCLDSQGMIKLGDIREQTFESIMNSKRVKDIYDGFSRREAVELLCKKCRYRTRFD